MRYLILIIFTALIVGACNRKAEESPSEIEPKLNVDDNHAKSFFVYNKEWRLIELNDEKITLDSTFRRYPHIIFQENNRVSGNLGCNNFGGEIEFLENNHIRITGISATEIACPNLVVEQQYLEILNKANALKVEGNKLMLSNEQEDMHAKFEFVNE